MAARNWRDVVRLARVHKSDRFQTDSQSSSDEVPPSAENEGSAEKVSSPEKAIPEPEMKHEESESRPARFASVDFRRKTTDSFRSGANKRASWSAAKHGSEFVQKMPPPPPKKIVSTENHTKAENGCSETPGNPANVQPPPARPAKAESSKSEEPSAPIKSEGAEIPRMGTEARAKTEPIRQVESENKRSMGTPTKPRTDVTNGSTPLQERSSNVIPNHPPKSILKPVKVVPTKAFAKLLKEGTQSYYEILGIQEDVEEKEILKSFRSWARVTHPDHNKEPSATEDFQALQQIYETLKNSKTRLAYNCRQKIRRCAFGSRARSSAAAY